MAKFVSSSKARTSLIVFLAMVICHVGVKTLAAQAVPSLVVPGFTAYSEPNPEALEMPDKGLVKGWADAKTTVAWYGQIRATGKLDIAVRLQLPAGDSSKLRMKVGDRELAVKTVRGAAEIGRAHV